MSAAQKLRAENERLRLAIHRIAVEKGMWSVLGNNVIVTVEPAITADERELLQRLETSGSLDGFMLSDKHRKTLRNLLARLGGGE